MFEFDLNSGFPWLSRTINKAKQIVTFENRFTLGSPRKIICLIKFDIDKLRWIGESKVG
jgi:hypothetical protein